MSLLSAVAEKGLDEVQHPEATQTASSIGGDARADFQKQYSYFPALSQKALKAIAGEQPGGAGRL